MAHTAQSLLEDLTPQEAQLLTEYLQNPSRFKASQETTHQQFFKNPRCMLAAMRRHQPVSEDFATTEFSRDIDWASEELKNNAEFMLAAMRIDPRAFHYASIALKSNEEFMLQAIAIDPKRITPLIGDDSLHLISNPHFYIQAMIQTPQAAYHFYEKSHILQAIAGNPIVIAHLNKSCLKNNEFINQALDVIQPLHLGIKFRPSIFWNIQRSNFNGPEINQYKTQFLMLESLKALGSITMAIVGVLLVASVISSPFALALGLPLIGLAVLCLGWMTKSHLEARHQSQMYARS